MTPSRRRSSPASSGAISVATPQRSKQLPDTPTAKESGLNDYEVATWAMIEGPAGLPRDVVTKLNTAIVAVVKSPQTKADHARWGAVVMKLGLQVDGF